MNKIFFTLLGILVSATAIAQNQQGEKFLHVNFGAAYSAVIPPPTSVVGARMQMVRNQHMGLDLSPAIAQSDTALRRQLEAALGQTDSSINQNQHSMTMTKEQGRLVAQSEQTAQSIQSQMSKVDPKSIQNMSMADKMKFAQQLMQNSGMQSQTQPAHQTSQPVQDTLMNLKTTFDSLAQVMQQMIHDYKLKESKILTATEPEHRVLDSAFYVKDTACHSNGCHEELVKRYHQENQDVENKALSQLPGVNAEFDGQFLPLVRKVDQFQTQLHDGNDLLSDPLRNSYRIMVRNALGGPLALESTTKEAIQQGVRWADEPDQSKQ